MTNYNVILKNNAMDGTHFEWMNKVIGVRVMKSAKTIDDNAGKTSDFNKSLWRSVPFVTELNKLFSDKTIQS